MKKISIAALSLLFMSCGSNTAIVNSWKDTDTTVAKEQFKKVLVVGLVKDEATRRITENRVVSSNPIFHSSYSFLNGNNLNLTKEQQMTILKNEKFDGVVTMRLVNVEKETSYVPGTNNIPMFYSGAYGNGFYGNGYGDLFGGWYSTYSPNFYTPGYYTETTYYFVETNVFSLNLNKLIWTGTTKSSYISDVGTTVDEIIAEVTKQMKKDGSIPK
ncbi:MAG: hypothetical protein KAX93_06885 [Flavobacterium sp.]|nr:hypothetical protein [Flavobacterium sp.]MBP8158086.1 hypothetical protein [Flavobacterium sp.]